MQCAQQGRHLFDVVILTFKCESALPFIIQVRNNININELTEAFELVCMTRPSSGGVIMRTECRAPHFLRVFS